MRSSFLAISRGWLYDSSKELISMSWMKYTFPGMLLWTFLYRPSWSDWWGANRITTYFVDVLSFTSITLFFSIISIVALNLFWYRINLMHRIYFL